MSTLLYRGRNSKDLQVQNFVTILGLIRTCGPVSRKEVARMAGLTPSTVTYAIRDLMERDLVVETGCMECRRGRKAVGLCINPGGRYVIGIRLARNYITGALFNLQGTIIRSERTETSGSTEVEPVMAAIRQLVRDFARDKELLPRIAAIGISTPGPLSIKEGKITFVSHFPGWRNVPLRGAIENEFHITTIIEHDANAAALAERWFGVGKEVDSLIYIAAGRGVGAGIIVNGQIYHGATGAAGEIGHMSIDLHGPRCECGNFGCLELYSSVTAILQKAREAVADPAVETSLKDYGYIDLARIFQAARNGDSVAIQLIRDAAFHLGVGVVNLINSYNPEMIILGDEMAAAGDLWIDTIREVTSSRLLPEVARSTRIVNSGIQGDPFLIGTGAIAIDYVFQHPEVLK